MGWKYLFIPKHQQFSCWSLEMDMYSNLTLYWVCDHLSILGFKLIYVTVKPVCNDHLYNNIYYLWFIQ